MSGMIDLWTRRSRREQGLLLVLALVAAGVLIWLSIMGLTDWRQTAEGRATAAANDHALALAATAMSPPDREPLAPGGLESLIRETASARNLAPATITPEQGGAVSVSFEAAATSALFGWIAELEAQGARVTGFTALKNPDGALQANVTLASDL